MSLRLASSPEPTSAGDEAIAEEINSAAEAAWEDVVFAIQEINALCRNPRTAQRALFKELDLTDEEAASFIEVLKRESVGEVVITDKMLLPPGGNVFVRLGPPALHTAGTRVTRILSVTPAAKCPDFIADKSAFVFASGNYATQSPYDGMRPNDMLRAIEADHGNGSEFHRDASALVDLVTRYQGAAALIPQLERARLRSLQMKLGEAGGVVINNTAAEVLYGNQS